MNRILKIGLLLQIPNIVILFSLAGFYLFNLIPWMLISSLIGYILLAVIMGLTNIFSAIFIIIGILND